MRFFRAFKYAVSGIAHCIKTERNIRIHIVVTAYVLVFAAFFELPALHWALLLLTIAAVLAAELLDTAVERVCDYCAKQRHPLIKAAKDMAAGAVLVLSVIAVAVGVCLFWQPQKLWEMVTFLCSDPALFTIFILTVVLSLLFVIIGPSGMAENAKWLCSRKKDKD